MNLLYFLVISIQCHHADDGQKDSDELFLVDGLVTRYGPRISCQRQGVNYQTERMPRVFSIYFHAFSYSCSIVKLNVCSEYFLFSLV